MFEAFLGKYQNCGSFILHASEHLRDKCNAPTDKAGIYLIFKLINDSEVLIYIGSSGQKTLDGTLKVRKGGMYDRLVNGYHPNRFGEAKRLKRHQAFPKAMKANGIEKIKIYWWVTYDDRTLDFPSVLESRLRQMYFQDNQRYPEWHT